MNRIKELRKKNNYTQTELCQKLGITQGALSGWESEKYEPDIKSLNKMAEIFNVSVDYLLCRNDRENRVKRKGVKIPVLGYVAAGVPIDAVESIIDYEEIEEEMAQQGEFFGLKIKGDSMEPRIVEGDVVIVRKQNYAENGDMVVAYINGDEATCKKIKKTPEGVYLISLNRKYDPFYYSNKEIDSLPVVICGKVVELRGKFE